MPLDLVATLIVGISAGGFTWLAFRAKRRRAPRFLIPLLTGGAMLSYAIWNEYSWAWRATDALPAGFEVIDRIPQSSTWQPWTYLVPRVSRLIMLDRAQLRRNERYPGYVLAEFVLLERLMPARRVIMLVDCENARRLDVTDGDHALEQGVPPDANWAVLRRDSSLFRQVCRTALQ